MLVLSVGSNQIRRGLFQHRQAIVCLIKLQQIILSTWLKVGGQIVESSGTNGANAGEAGLETGL